MADANVQFETNVAKLSELLSDQSLPMGKRFDVLFQLRSNNSVSAMKAIANCLLDPKEDSALLKHELAYCIGQMQLKEAIPFLSQVLSNESENTMVRHEAGEALGAIGCESAAEILKKYIQHKEAAISETCQLAIERLKDVGADRNQNKPTGGFGSIDPAVFADELSPQGDTNELVDPLQERLINEKLPLYERYVAMFKLRNINSTESTRALCKGFGASSALFRHEVAYVLGQMQNESSIKALSDVLANTNEESMVRHECAEALGSIASEHPEVTETLKLYLNDPDRVVKESCEVALEISHH
ncbi:deoxyhypusine hydroxylase-like [Convolutriloba macropyga]|uniref:deoxyhypusine hydroxylase-like n=1 Tax=Convolutriloba macropyga TaxID=536237 RepID=UPI003F51C5BA